MFNVTAVKIWGIIIYPVGLQMLDRKIKDFEVYKFSEYILFLLNYGVKPFGIFIGPNHNPRISR